MPTVFTHAIVPLAAGLALGKARIHTPVIVTGMALSILPDADVIGFKLGIDYAHELGHRGASHALLIAAAGAALATAIFRPARWMLIFAFLFLSMASHGLLDTLTNGGLGAFPARPIFFWGICRANWTRWIATGPTRPIAPAVSGPARRPVS